MGGPLEGYTIVDAGLLVAGPAAAGILCDWGADVIKVEPLEGDSLRGWFPEPNPPFSLDNRGKRSIALDLRSDSGKEVFFKVLAGADALVTNTRPASLRRLGIAYEDLAARFPELVYCHVTGFGREGVAADRPAFDATAIWARAGVGATIQRGEQEIPQARAGFGDHMTAMNAAGAICAALLARERTGRGQLVTISLLRTGHYMLSWDIMVKLFTGRGARSLPRSQLRTPLGGYFKTQDDRWLTFMGNPQVGHDLPAILKAIGREEWLSDPRFESRQSRAEHVESILAELDAVIATRPLAEWSEAFDAAGIWWEPFQTVDDVVDDPFARDAGCFVQAPLEAGEGATPVRMAATPSDFSDTPSRPQGPPPELGEHSVDILRELGYGDGAVDELVARGVVRGR